MNPTEEHVSRDEAQINGQTEGSGEGPGVKPDAQAKDNFHKPEQENSANGLDTDEVRGGQDGRNNRGIGSTDMDSKNGVLRMGDQDNSTMEVTDEALANASADKTGTSIVNVTTAGPDDYASDAEVNVPNAQEEAKKQSPDAEEGDSIDDSGTTGNPSETKESEDVAETGTSIDHQPTY